MNVFRIISILVSIAFIVLLIVSFNVEQTEGMKLAVLIGGIITAVMNLISTVMWWLTDSENQRNAWQLSWFSRGFH